MELSRYILNNSLNIDLNFWGTFQVYHFMNSTNHIFPKFVIFFQWIFLFPKQELKSHAKTFPSYFPCVRLIMESCRWLIAVFQLYYSFLLNVNLISHQLFCKLLCTLLLLVLPFSSLFFILPSESFLYNTNFSLILLLIMLMTPNFLYCKA